MNSRRWGTLLLSASLASSTLLLSGCAAKRWRPESPADASIELHGVLESGKPICRVFESTVSMSEKGARIDGVIEWRGDVPRNLPAFRVILSAQGKEKRPLTYGAFFEKLNSRHFRIPVRVPENTDTIELCFATTSPAAIQIVDASLYLTVGPTTPEFLSSIGFELESPQIALEEFRADLLKDHGITVRLPCASNECEQVAHFEQKEHRFPIGTAVSTARVLGEDADSVRYREILREYFTSATPENDLKTLSWVGEWKDFPREQTLRALKWLKANGFEIRGHALYWGSWQHMPRAWQSLPSDALAANINSTVADVLRVTKPYVDEWDVVNEPYRHRTVTEKLGFSFVSQLIESVRKQSTVPLLVNDFSNLETLTPDNPHFSYLRRFVGKLQQSRGRVDAIGLQGHFAGYPLPSFSEVARKLDVVASLGLPIRITELDIDIADETLQAEYLQGLLRLFYRHPAVQGVSLWGFWEAEHWRPSSGLWRADWSERPLASVFRTFLKESLLSGTGIPSGKGEIEFRLVPGKYQIRIGEREQTVLVPDPFMTESTGGR